jgi:hypothetical protein
MAKSDLLNSPNSSSNLTGESSELDRLFKKYPRSTTGNIVFVSSTSGTTYDMATYLSGLYNNQGEQGMLLLLQSVLANYMINASDFNNKVEQSVFNSHTADNAMAHDIDIIRLAKTCTGLVNVLVVDTSGTFDLTKDGNVLTIVPNLTNTGASTVAVDGQTAKAIKKFDIGTDAYIATEAEDLKKNTPAQLVWSVGSDFFILRPSSGANALKSLLNTFFVNQRTISTQTTTLRQSVTGSGWILGFTQSSSTNDKIKLKIDGTWIIGNDTQAHSYAADDRIQPFFIRFDSSFEFYSQLNYIKLVFVLGDDFSKPLDLNVYQAGAGTGTTANTLLNVTGKGWFLDFTFASTTGAANAVTIIIDGVTEISGTDFGVFPFMLRFEQSLVINTEIAQHCVNYSLD